MGSDFSLHKGSVSKIVIIFRVNMSPSKHIDNKKKDILFLVKSSTQRLDDTILIAEAQYWINFSRSSKIFCLSLHYNGINSFLFVNAIKIYHFKAKDSEIKEHYLCLENISGFFSDNNMN